MAPSAYKLIPDDFTPAPSLLPERVVDFGAVTELSAGLGAVGIAVTADGAVPEELGLDRDALGRAGFDGKPGQTLVIPGSAAPLLIAVGAGPEQETTADSLRDLAATFARAASTSSAIGLRLPATAGIDPETVGQVVAEGILLGRYRYSELKSDPKTTVLAAVELLVDEADASGVTAGIPRGVVAARSANLARDLTNTPPGHLTATDFADLAVVARRIVRSRGRGLRQAAADRAGLRRPARRQRRQRRRAPA